MTAMKSKTIPAAVARNPLFRKGLKLRKSVIGSEYVERRLAGADQYSWPMEEITTAFAWGMVWSRPGLSRKTRSFLNLAMLTAMNMRIELKTHIKGALRNGLTRMEVAETLLHCAVYCGFPKAIDGLRIMQEAFGELDAETRQGRKRRR